MHASLHRACSPQWLGSFRHQSCVSRPHAALHSASQDSREEAAVSPDRTQDFSRTRFANADQAGLRRELVQGVWSTRRSYCSDHGRQTAALAVRSPWPMRAKAPTLRSAISMSTTMRARLRGSSRKKVARRFCYPATLPNADVASAIDETVKAFGRIDILVNNAGYQGKAVESFEAARRRADRARLSRSTSLRCSTSFEVLFPHMKPRRRDHQRRLDPGLHAEAEHSRLCRYQRRHRHVHEGARLKR